jgi:TRAP-type C4-dicarboxylate transport system substrate-binding protein
MKADRQFRRAAGAVAVTAVLLVAGCAATTANKAGGSDANAVVLTLADSENTPDTVQAFADAVNSLSSGSLRIRVKLNWRQGDAHYESHLIRDVESGKSADLGAAGVRAFDVVGVNSFRALVAPLLIDSYPLETQVLRSDIPNSMLKGLEPAGMTGLVVLPGPLRKPLGLTRPLVSAGDYRGARIGNREGRVNEDTMRALGAIDTIYLPRHISGLDGMEMHLDGIPGNNYDRNATELTGNVNLWPRAQALFINSRRWTALDAQQQGWLRQAAAQSLSSALGTLDPKGRTASEADVLCQRGLKIVSATDGELAGIRHAVQPVYDELERDPQTAAWLVEIAKMRQTSRAPADDPGSCDGSSLARKTTTITPLDGTWVVSFSRAEFLAAGADPSEDLPENYGQFTMTFHKGNFQSIASNPNGTASGIYLVQGPKLTLTVTGGCCAGDTFTATWSVYRDTLTFKGGVPTGFRVKPWRRISR